MRAVAGRRHPAPKPVSKSLDDGEERSTERMPDKVRKVFANAALCTGCELCVAACSVTHGGENNRNLSGISICRNLMKRFEAQFICRHCEEPAACIDSCITGAMYRDSATGFVLCAADRCAGCFTCVMACPYDSLHLNRETGAPEGRVVVKCDGCPELEIPACVAVCTTGALVIEPEEAVESKPGAAGVLTGDSESAVGGATAGELDG